ncbi:hypothetical protein [Paenibacillus sp. TH7-28]
MSGSSAKAESAVHFRRFDLNRFQAPFSNALLHFIALNSPNSARFNCTFAFRESWYIRIRLANDIPVRLAKVPFPPCAEVEMQSALIVSRCRNSLLQPPRKAPIVILTSCGIIKKCVNVG